MSISGEPSIYTPFGSATVNTTIQAAITPSASTKTVVLNGLYLAQMAGAAGQIDLTDGTAADAGTVLTFPVNSSYPLNVQGLSKKLSTAGNPLGIKARGGGGTFAGSFYSREAS